MIAQMENQDPTQPMDQLAFMSQLAQFGTVSGVQELNVAMSDLATKYGQSGDSGFESYWKKRRNRIQHWSPRNCG